MQLSVACSFAPQHIEQLGRFSSVGEVYGKLDKDIVGGGRSTYTLPPINLALLQRTIQHCHSHNIRFNYLLNGATLDGIEFTTQGQRALRRLLDRLCTLEVDAVTVASPYLLRLVKSHYPSLAVRVSVFATIDTPRKAAQWEQLGADTLCISAIACNRSRSRLEAIRAGVHCELQLIANASCLLNCSYEATHMQLLTKSSRSGDRLGGFCLDYCFLHCSAERLRESSNLLRACWIRPEDLHLYEQMGYHSFKLVERSCPPELMNKRVAAYHQRRFEGNLWELVAPIAQVSSHQQVSLRQRMRRARIMLRPGKVRLQSILALQRYAQEAIPVDFSFATAPVYIDNQQLEGFAKGVLEQGCESRSCEHCTYCDSWAQRVVRVDPHYRERLLEQAHALDSGMVDGTHWRL